jgi:beta-glucosidase/6-phospho-beta-glucosidase/beta-galactosidase
MQNPYFSDNSSSSQLTSKLRRFSVEWSKFFDKSDNESSAMSLVSGAGPSKQTKLSHYQSNVNEPIEEEEDEKEEPEGKKLIS